MFQINITISNEKKAFGIEVIRQQIGAATLEIAKRIALAKAQIEEEHLIEGWAI